MARVKRILIEKDVVVPRRDGTDIAGDLYRLLTAYVRYVE
jgi:hypothetical protein